MKYVSSTSTGIDCDFVFRGGDGPKSTEQHTENTQQRKFPRSLDFYLICTAVLASFYDTASTILSTRAVGYSYEGNAIIREVIHSAGILGFAGMKFSVTFLALFMVYYIIRHNADFGWKNVKMFYGIYAGAVISSFFVATSNLSVVYADSSFYFLGLNSLQIGLLLLFTAPIAGFLLDVQDYSRSAAYATEDKRNTFTRAGSVLVAYMNYLYSPRDAGKSMAKK